MCVFMSINSTLFCNFIWGMIPECDVLDITKIGTSRQQMSEGKLPLVTSKDAILTTYFEFLQNISKFENIKHLTRIST